MRSSTLSKMTIMAPMLRHHPITLTRHLASIIQILWDFQLLEDNLYSSASSFQGIFRKTTLLICIDILSMEKEILIGFRLDQQSGIYAVEAFFWFLRCSRAPPSQLWWVSFCLALAF